MGKVPIPLGMALVGISFSVQWERRLLFNSSPLKAHFPANEFLRGRFYLIVLEGMNGRGRVRANVMTMYV